MKFVWRFTLTLAIFIFFCEFCFAGIQGSKHDFSNKAWNSSGEICAPCHTPHHADVTFKPLWNHQTSTANFRLYSSATLKQTPEQPRPASLQCLSCHDGTVALDSFGGNNGSTMIDQANLIGVDLSKDHPVSIKWTHQLQGAINCFACHVGGSGGGALALKNGVPFYDGYVECATCHDVHNGSGNPKFLRQTMNQSALCTHCHQQ